MPDIFKNANKRGVKSKTKIYIAPVGMSSLILGLDIANKTGAAITVKPEIVTINVLLDAAITEDNGTGFTDNTTAANTDLSNFNPFPVTEAANDAFYIGSDSIFENVSIEVITAGVKNVSPPILTWEYWNGTTWAALTGVVDGTNDFTTTGTNSLTFTVPADWTTNTINSQGPFYYVRLIVTTLAGGYDTNPILDLLSLEVVTSLINDVSINANTSFQTIEGQKHVLSSGDFLQVTASDLVDVTTAILEDIN